MIQALLGTEGCSALLPNSPEEHCVSWAGVQKEQSPAVLYYITSHDYVASRNIMLRDMTLHYTTLHYTTLHYTALHCTALHCTALHCTALHCTALHCTALHCTALHYITLHSIALHGMAWHGIALYNIAFPVLGAPSRGSTDKHLRGCWFLSHGRIRSRQQAVLTCQWTDLSFLVQLRCLPLNLLLVIAVQALDVVDCGFQILNCNAALHLRTDKCNMSMITHTGKGLGVSQEEEDCAKDEVTVHDQQHKSVWCCSNLGFGQT